MARKTVAKNAEEIAHNDTDIGRIGDALSALYDVQDAAFRAQNDGQSLVDVYGDWDTGEEGCAVMDSLTAQRVGLARMKMAMDGKAEKAAD